MKRTYGANLTKLGVALVAGLSFLISACGDDSGGDSVQEVVKKHEQQYAQNKDWRYPRDPNDLPDDMRLVTENYGMPVVKEGEQRYHAGIRPWSSWWFPFSSPELHKSEDAPLKKYDEYVERTTGDNPRSSDYHRKNRYNPAALGWEGLCDAWSIASVYEEEPKKPALINGTCFSPYDLKALAILSYEKVDPAHWMGWYGQRNDNRFANVYSDIYPEQLHRFIQVQLRDRNMPFVMDHNPGRQVWSQSVSSAIVRVSRREGRNDVVDVELLLEMAKYQLSDEEKRRDRLEGVGTIASIRQYTYELYGEWRGDEFHVKEGYWLSGSLEDHPDYVVELPESAQALGERGSYNPNLSVSHIDEILEKAKTAPTCVPKIDE